MPPKKTKTPPKPKLKSKTTPVETLKHKDKRKNIPTSELSRFASEQEKQPQTILYPRDPSLDPQLVWKGKDEQDAKALEVPAVPIYIQEMIQPQAIIENVRAEAQKGAPAQLAMFSDFNGLPFKERVDFYRHEQNWTNRMILGDSLLVMTSLAEKEGLKGQVQMIYIDPPYGIKFGSNWQVSTRKRDVKDGKVEDATRQPEQVKAFRDTWELGIHSYLAYLRDRLTIAHELLAESGSVFVQIGDENVHLVRNLLDEVFGSENFISLISFTTSVPLGASYVPGVTNFILWYSKQKEHLKFRRTFQSKPAGGEGAYGYVQLPDGSRRSMTSEEKDNQNFLPEGSLPFFSLSMLSAGTTPSCVFPVEYAGNKYYPGAGRSWKTNERGMKNLFMSDRIYISGNTLRYVLFHKDYPVSELTNLWSDTAGTPDKIYVVQTSSVPIERCLLMTTDPGDLVLDPTCGGGTTAYVAETWGRRWITIDTSRVALALARTRLMSARFPYYLLADSPEGAKKQAELIATHSPSFAGKGQGVRFDNDIKKGFVYKRVPHFTLGSISNNEEIDTIYSKWQEDLEPVRHELNRVLKQSWEEWQIPRDAGKDWSTKAKELHTHWWEMRRSRQKEIDDSIELRGDVELLYNDPYDDNKRLRVTGPFTVESLSPHRMLSTDQDAPKSVADAKQHASSDQFETIIIENLAKAGVQNARKNERLKFDRLDTYAGEWIHAAGEYADKNGKTQRVAVCIGPQYNTVGPDLVKDAAKEALRGMGFDLLIVCGFSFDAMTNETAHEFTPDLSRRKEGIAARETRIGKLPILLARMNPDLSMGDELLKKTGAGNLFMVFGEPDIEFRKIKGDKFTVTIKGLDVYDPTTGEIRNSSTDDIACWFIDTNYNEESFFVRHAYFLGADEPYEKLKRALRAEVDEATWSMLYATTSQPFDLPATGRIAVKVINHYGDEVLRVYQV